jgi:hypothetical protein
MKMPEEEKQEEKSTIKFSGTERTILSNLSNNVGLLANAIDRLTQQVMDLVNKG